MKKIIRALKSGDLGWIIAQHGAIYAKEFGFNMDFEVNIAKKAIALYEKKDGFTCFWIIEINGENVASIAISQIDEETTFINFVIVSDAYRGRGLANELMNIVLNYARKNDFKKMRLETYSCLTKARNMYAKYGFEMKEVTQEPCLYGQTLDREFWEMNLK